MTALANEYKAINLSQGFPDFPVDAELISLVNKAMQEGYNQYAPMPGLLGLKEGISNSILQTYNKIINAESEITVTSGATEALFAAISVVINHGDEVIMFDPAYDSYEPAVILNNGIPVRIPLTFPDFRINWDEVKNAVNKKTKLIILNSPNNPAGTIISEDDIKELKEIVSKKKWLKPHFHSILFYSLG